MFDTHYFSNIHGAIEIIVATSNDKVLENINSVEQSMVDNLVSMDADALADLLLSWIENKD